MLAAKGINLRIRTQSSQQYSYSGCEVDGIEHSFESINFIDESISHFIHDLYRHQQNDANSRHKISSKSHSYILVDEQKMEKKQKCTSMKKQSRQGIEMIVGNVLTQLISHHRCLNLGRSDVSNRAYGAMFGFVIGDAMGAYVVNFSLNQQQINSALLMKGGGSMNLKSGQCTDQWEICLTLSEALIESQGKYDQNIVAQKYLQWLESQPFDLPVLMGIAFGDIRRKRRRNVEVQMESLGEQLRLSSLINVKQQSNLGLIRLIPMVIWTLYLEDYQFQQIIIEEMKLIAPNPFVTQTALIYANILRTIILTGDHMLAYHQASQTVYNFGSQKMNELWRCIQQNLDPIMNNSSAKNLKHPFIYAINQLLEIDREKDNNRHFIESSVRVLSEGFNTDTNCSIVLGLVGAILGYNGIPSFFRQKILNSNPIPTKQRVRDYHSRKVVEIVDKLMSNGAIPVEQCDF